MMNPLAWLLCAARGYHRSMVSDLHEHLPSYAFHARCTTCGSQHTMTGREWMQEKEPQA